MALGDYILCCKCEDKLIYDGDRSNREWWKERYGTEPEIKCPKCSQDEPVAWANRVIGGKKWLSIHASKGASDRWLEYRLKEQAQGEEYEQCAFTLFKTQRESYEPLA